MLDLAGKPPAPPKPEVDLKSINQPSVLTEVLAGGLIGVVGILTLVIFFVARTEAKKVAALDEQYATLSTQVQTGKLAETTAKAEQVAEALAVLKSQGNNGLAWSALLKTLQGVSTKGINLVSLSVDARNTLKIEGASPSYLLLAHYLATLRTAPVLEKADLLSAALVEGIDGQRINFVVQIEIDPNLAPKAVSTSGEGN